MKKEYQWTQEDRTPEIDDEAQMAGEVAAEEALEKLKQSWLEDPCWDIEDTEGFEEHREELLKFRKAFDAEQRIKAEYKAQTRQKVVFNSTGIDDYDLAQSLLTFAEIENDATQIGRRADSYSVDASVVQIHATLLLAAEVKRIADVLNRIVEKDEQS